MIPASYSPGDPPAAQARALLPSLGLPVEVADAMRRVLAGDARRPAPGRRSPLQGGWWLRGGASGSLALFQASPNATPRRWACADSGGRLHSLLRWAEPAADGPLLGAALLLPGGGWLEVKPGAARHPLWGAADLLSVRQGGELREVARCQAVNYARIGCIPPVDRPAHLPPGAGEALLNLLAVLLADQGATQVTYRGPYPTEQLFHSLLRSFRCPAPAAETLHAFTREAPALALSGESGDNPVAWQPRPYEPVRAAEGVCAHIRDGVETVWVGEAPYRRAAATEAFTDAFTETCTVAAQAAGARVWREEGDGDGDGDAEYHVGLVLLGAPYRRVGVLNGRGGLTEWHQAPPGDSPADENRIVEKPATRAWQDAVFAWAALNSTAALAPGILALQGRLPAVWAHLPHALAAIDNERLLLQAGAFDQFRRLREGRESGALALMLISDVLSGAVPLLRRQAQAMLEAAPPPDWGALPRQGEAARRTAGITLNRVVPGLARSLAEGGAGPAGAAPQPS